MSRFKRSMPPAYFEQMYASSSDPWSFANSSYEREKYEATLDALPRRLYSSAFEVGCSIGVLSQRLADRCERLLSVDVAASALSQAAKRCADLPHVEFEVMRVPEHWPNRTFDLILLSEVIYYLDSSDVTRLAKRVTDGALSDCDVLLVHWLGQTNYPLTGDEAADSFIAALSPKAKITEQKRTKDYRLDLLRIIS